MERWNVPFKEPRAYLGPPVATPEVYVDGFLTM